MKSQCFLAVTALLYSLCESANGIHVKRFMDPREVICEMGKFTVGREIGHGLNFHIYEVTRKEDNKIFAMKVGNASLSNEINSLSHMYDVQCVAWDQNYFIIDKESLAKLIEAK